MYDGDYLILVKMLRLDKFQDYRRIQTHMLLKNRAIIILKQLGHILPLIFQQKLPITIIEHFIITYLNLIFILNNTNNMSAAVKVMFAHSPYADNVSKYVYRLSLEIFVKNAYIRYLYSTYI